MPIYYTGEETCNATGYEELVRALTLQWACAHLEVSMMFREFPRSLTNCIIGYRMYSLHRPTQY